VVEVVGLVAAVGIAFVSGEPFPSTESVVWALAAGCAGITGLAFFYIALSRGTMGAVAPLAALIGAGLPVVVSIAGGASVSTGRAIGIAGALAAVVLISLPGGERTVDERRRLRIDLREMPWVLGAGLGFAGFFLLIQHATENGETWWPQVAVRVAGTILLSLGFIVALRRARGSGQSLRRRADVLLGLPRLRARALPAAQLSALFLLTGLGDLGGNSLFLLASHADAYAIAVVLSSLYPVVTTILAALLLRERLRPLQILGVVLATISVTLLR
jgi:drug/metabolite transporter (DMT)-like permease